MGDTLSKSKIILGEDQKHGFKVLQDFIESDRKFGLLDGPAGTGKTFLLNYFMEEMMKAKKIRKVCMSAPTNAAVNVLERGAIKKNNKIVYQTLHKLLELKASYENGKLVFKKKKDFYNDHSLTSFDLIVIDECSMISNKVWEILMEEINPGGLDFGGRKKIKVLFMGDSYQIPPVRSGEKERSAELLSQPFQTNIQNHYNFITARLTEPQRQSEHNPILKFANHIRANMQHPYPLNEMSSLELDDENYVYFVKLKNRAWMLEELSEWFNMKNTQDYPNKSKIIAYRNVVVNDWNRWVRGKLYADSKEELCENEFIIMADPVVRGVEIVYNKSDLIKVSDVESERGDFHGREYDFYTCSAKEHYKGKENELRLLKSYEWGKFSNHLHELKIDAFRRKKEGDRHPWKDFISLINTFPKYKYNYAITAHLSQGMTYDQTVVSRTDINTMGVIGEKNRILYTALTRAKYRTLLI